MERDQSMAYNNEPHFSELIWEGDEQNMAVPSREDVRAEETKRAAAAEKNRGLKEKSRSKPGGPEQLKLWDLELPDRREEQRRGRAEAVVPQQDKTIRAKEGGTRGEERSTGDWNRAVTEAEARKEQPSAGRETSTHRNRFEMERTAYPSDRSIGDGEQAPSKRPATMESQFVEHARELAGDTEVSAEFVKFKSYWPTYGHMTGPQTKWYFYWRNEVRHGRYPETDLSYIFLHVYELINGVGWETPQDGYEQLSRLWEAYRDTFKRLDHYLGGWIADFSFIHKLDIPLREIVVRAKGLGGDLAEIELMRCLASAPEQLTLPALSLMSDYDMTKSKFYSGPGNEALERFVPQVVALVDAYAKRKHGNSLLEMYPPGPPVTRERYLFRSAVYDISLYGYSVLVPVVRISKSPSLRSLITRLFRLAENKLRTLMDYRGRLKGISIDKDIEELVGKFLEREFRKAEREEKGPDIVIDKDKLERLRGDSDVVRHLLTVEEPLEALEEKSTYGDWPVVEPHDVDGSDGILPVELLVEGAVQGQHIVAGYGEPTGSVGYGEDVLDSRKPEEDLPSAENEAVKEASAAALHAGGADTLVTQGELNNPKTLVTSPGCEWVAMAETAGGAAAPEAQAEPILLETMDSMPGSEWEALTQVLSPLQREAVLALSGPDGPAELRRLATAHAALPDLLIDEINEIAMDVIGDLLIDGEEISPEYASLLQYLKR
ncbi:TerB N-terminal domain-containing protein [Paenibacillus apii]|nr:TerB N-terminal domain-containing protein [Paenibacillus apii]